MVCLWSAQLDWPHGSSALTAHKHRQGLQMTTCHCPGPVISSSPGSLNRCLGCHCLKGLPYGEMHNKAKTINLRCNSWGAAHRAVGWVGEGMREGKGIWKGAMTGFVTLRNEGSRSVLVSHRCILYPIFFCHTTISASNNLIFSYNKLLPH